MPTRMGPVPSPEDPGTSICSRYDGVAPEGLMPRIHCDQVTTGQYVVVQVPGDSECLTLCEVGIYRTCKSRKYS